MMTFARVNEQVIRCTIPISEVEQMGYNVQELFSNKERATSFAKEVVAEAGAAGVLMKSNYQIVNQIAYDNEQVVMNIVDMSTEQQINYGVARLLSAYDIVRYLGRERVERILYLPSPEKEEEFNRCIREINEVLKGGKRDIPNKYILKFSSLNRAEAFCMNIESKGNGRLYKDKDSYYLYTDLADADESFINSFLLTAEEYCDEITEASMQGAYLEEHAQVIIKENPIDVLKNL